MEKSIYDLNLHENVKYVGTELIFKLLEYQVVGYIILYLES